MLLMYDITKIHHLRPLLSRVCLSDEQVPDVHTSLQSNPWLSVSIVQNIKVVTCSGPVASSADLSSLTLINRGNRNEMPRSST